MDSPQGESFNRGPPVAGGESPFAEALKRAREISAGMGMRDANGSAEDGEPNLKRPYEDGGLGDQPAKKPMIDIAGPGASSAQIDLALAQAQAQAKAAQFLAQAGATVGGVQNTEEMVVPNKMVGVIIGRGGETINRLQAESGARIQCASADPSNPHADRALTLTGTQDCIQKARCMVQDLVNQGPSDHQGGGPGGLMGQAPMGGGMLGMGGMGAPPAMGGGEVYEQLIPQPKVGLIIGKGGETIKRLQEQAGCRMQMIQDGQYTNAPERLLRIQGTPNAIEAAKGLVNDLIGGSEHSGTLDMEVPSNLVGMVIGRGGESIKRIQAETGVRIQFNQENQARSRPGVRMATLVGPPEGLPQAQKMVFEILERGNEQQQQQGPGGAGRMPMGGGGMGGNSVEFPVPHDRCGLVIGRGGETIRALQTQSGAHIQLNRNAPCGPGEKVFTIRGTREQISHAEELIREKCDMPPGGGGGAPSGGGYGQPGMQPGMGGPGMYPPHGQPMQQPYAAYPMQQQPQQGYPQPGGGMQPDQVQAAWAAYYQQYYSQMAAAANPTGMAQGQSGAPAGAQQGAPGGVQQTPQQGASAAGGQDLQAQWAEYYRQLGYSYPQQGAQR